MTHDLKVWPAAFKATVEGTKRHEWRPHDRNFAVGDRLRLQEFKPNGPIGEYTGHEVTVLVTYMTLTGTHDMPEGYCVMSIWKLDGSEQ